MKDMIAKTPIINIAPLAGKVTISSKSRWSTVDDEREILTAEHDRPFSFHTELEDSPWIIVDLKKNYYINYIRILNRLDICKEKSKSLRIEYSNDNKNYDIILDIDKVWGDVFNIPIKNKLIRFLKFSLKEKHYFHLKKIEIFTDLDFFIQNCVDSKENEIAEICYLIYQKFNKRFILSFYDNNFNQIILSEKDDIKGYIRYNISFSFEKKEIFFNIEITTKHYRCPDFYFFITTKAQQFNYKINIVNNKDKICLFKKITNNVVIENIQFANILVKSTVMYPFLKILNQRRLIANKDKYNNINNNILIIEPDLIIRSGFADRLKGILSIITICNEMNIDFYIKFNRPFRLNRYYEFKDYNSIEPSRLKDINHYSLILTTPSSVKYFELKEILLYSLKFYNTISIGTNMFFADDGYNIFQKNFKKTEFLEEKLSHYREIINGEYITISFRFLNCLGDFNDTDLSKTTDIDEDKQVSLIKKCEREILKFKKIIDKRYKIVVLSDSSRFLNYISNISNVYVFPENIMHIGENSQNTTINEDNFMKTIIDFNIIMESSHVYRFKTEYLYNTGFPLLAAICSGKPFSQHEF